VPFSKFQARPIPSFEPGRGVFFFFFFFCVCHVTGALSFESCVQRKEKTFGFLFISEKLDLEVGGPNNIANILGLV
jgi:hypothetical protein